MRLRTLVAVGLGCVCWACSDSDGNGNDGDGTGGGVNATGGSTGTGGSVATGGSGGVEATTGGAGGMMQDAGAVVLEPADYSEDANWLCRPGLDDNECDAELSVTEFAADGTTMTYNLPEAGDSEVDCFYVYPTVDLDVTSVDNKDFPDIDRDKILDPLLAQAAPLRDLCNIYAPLYRQASIGAFLADPAVAQEKLGNAFSDVAAAFAYYLEHFDTGKPLVLLGHSQGAMMTTLLIQSVVDADADLRARLVTALVIGSLGFYTVPEDGVVGGSFMNVPLCTSKDETGCVVSYNAYADGFPPPENYGNLTGTTPPGQLAACTNPGAIAGGASVLAGALLPTDGRQDQFRVALDFGTDVGTYFARYPDFFTAECTPADNGHPYLKISATPAQGDARQNPVPFDDPNLSPAVLGLHILDYSFGSGDLRALLEAKIAAH